MTAAATTATTEINHIVVSQDGAHIGYLTVGSGPSVVVIPGALTVATDYLSFARALAGQFTIHIIERRGRGTSSPQGAGYSIDTECEDVLALQRETGASFLAGHSYGGLVALEVARRTQVFTKAAVYEPGISINGSIPMGWMPTYRQALTDQRYFDALIEFVRGTGPERTRHTPTWLLKLLLPLFLRASERQQMLRLLPENLREHEELARLDNTYENYRAITAPVLLMYGGKSESMATRVAVEGLEVVLPRSQTRVFPKLDHFGMERTGPQEVARVVSAYFLEKSLRAEC